MISSTIDMRCPILNELPPPPPGKTGWPWTEESPQLPDTMPDGSPGPRVSIVTPSYNQAQFLEETIRSVLLQGYPNLEYIIIDGGSTDGSVDIIRKYEPWLAYWVSERDKGQADALNKGLRIAKGDIIGWLNSDDLYEPGALSLVARYFVKYPEACVVYGNITFVDEHSAPVRQVRPNYSREKFVQWWRYKNVGVPSCAAFYRREVFDQVGGFDTNLHYVLDYEFYLRAGEFYGFHYLPELNSCFRVHTTSKTGTSSTPFARDTMRIVKSYWGQRDPLKMPFLLLSAWRSYWRAVLNDILSGAESGSPLTLLRYLWALLLYPGLSLQLWFWKASLQRALGPQRAASLKRVLTEYRVI